MDDDPPNPDADNLQIPEELRIRSDTEYAPVLNEEALELNAETAKRLRSAIRSSAACKRGRWLLTVIAILGIGLLPAAFGTKPEVVPPMVFAMGSLLIGWTVHFQLGV